MGGVSLFIFVGKNDMPKVSFLIPTLKSSVGDKFSEAAYVTGINNNFHNFLVKIKIVC
jgi:hypothetical protein